MKNLIKKTKKDGRLRSLCKRFVSLPCILAIILSTFSVARACGDGGGCSDGEVGTGSHPEGPTITVTWTF